MKGCYRSEEELVSSALQSGALEAILGYEGWRRWAEREADGLFGVPDLLYVFGKRNICGARLVRSIAFEMKLYDWRRAIIQAFRYSAFSHYSYVVLDNYYVRRALKGRERFEKSGVGLASLNGECQLKVHIKAQYRRPYSSHTFLNLFERVEASLFPDDGNHLENAHADGYGATHP